MLQRRLAEPAAVGRRDARRLLGRRGVLLTEAVLRWLAIARALLRSAARRRVAVMDRYAVCQYASVRVQGGGRSWERFARLAYRVFPRPDITFLLAVDPAEAYRRIELRGTDHETLEYLAGADRAYRSLPEFADFVVIDANRTPDEVSRDIRRRLAAGPAPEPPPAASAPVAPPPVASAPLVPPSVVPSSPMAPPPRATQPVP